MTARGARTFSDRRPTEVAAGPVSALAWLFQGAMATIFSGRSLMVFKTGLRVLGYMAMPQFWMDRWLERHPMTHRVASGFCVPAVKPGDENRLLKPYVAS
jgi:hypothetical protein